MDRRVTFELPPLIYNLCFLTRRDQVLMLLRNKPPNRGLWNGVGGHIEPGEDPLDSVLREVREETGYVLASARFCGLLTWEGYEIPAAGLYIYTAPAPDGVSPVGEGGVSPVGEGGVSPVGEGGVSPVGEGGKPHPAQDGGAGQTLEGTLAWKPLRWIFTSDEVPSNIHYFGPLALGGAAPQVYHFVYRAGLIQRHEVRPLPPGFNL